MVKKYSPRTVIGTFIYLHGTAAASGLRAAHELAPRHLRASARHARLRALRTCQTWRRQYMYYLSVHDQYMYCTCTCISARCRCRSGGPGVLADDLFLSRFPVENSVKLFCLHTRAPLRSTPRAMGTVPCAPAGGLGSVSRQRSAGAADTVQKRPSLRSKASKGGDWVSMTAFETSSCTRQALSSASRSAPTG